MDFELVINNGTIIDGYGNPRYTADIGISEGKIQAISPGEHLVGKDYIDATGLIVAPGFIDIHSHCDWVLPLSDHDQILAPMILQGMTTLVAGNCGFSPAPLIEDAIGLVEQSSEMIREAAFPYRWRSMGEFLDVLENQGVVLNAAFLVGHGTLRLSVMGERADAPTAIEMETMRQLTRESIREGAYGLSTGLGYAPGMFAGNDEIFRVLQVVAEEGGIYTVHGRAYSCVTPFYGLDTELPHNRISNLEQLELGRKTGVRLQLSHLLFHGRKTWQTYKDVIQDVNRAADEGLDVALDAFPYTFGNTTINVNFSAEFLNGFSKNINDPQALQKAKAQLETRQELIGKGYEDIYLLWAGKPDLSGLEGLDFMTIAKQLRMSPFDAYMHITRESKGTARILQNTYSGDSDSEEPLRAILEHPLCAFMLDSILTRRGKQNPASFGTFPKILGKYSRDEKLFSLEEAVKRMTSFSAERVGLKNLGGIKEGYWADLVLFDPAIVDDHTSLQNPEASPTGIKTVMISGHLLAQDGKIVSNQRWGRVLRN